MAHDKDNQVFCAGLGGNYFHEVVHVHLNHLYSKSPLKEGLAAFYGGSMGRSINWHMKRVNRICSNILALTETTKKWTQPVHNWGLIVNQFLAIFGKGLKSETLTTNFIYTVFWIP